MHGRNFNGVVGERDEFGYFYCRAGCDNVFLTKTTRNRLEIHVNSIMSDENEHFVD